MHITVPTPEGWKCERENCTTDFYHTHGTYPSLEKVKLNELFPDAFPNK